MQMAEIKMEVTKTKKSITLYHKKYCPSFVDIYFLHINFFFQQDSQLHHLLVLKRILSFCLTIKEKEKLYISKYFKPAKYFTDICSLLLLCFVQLLVLERIWRHELLVIPSSVEKGDIIKKYICT